MSWRQWLFLWLLKLAYNLANYKYARHITTLLKLLSPRVNSSWIHSTRRGTWIAKGAGNALPQKLEDHIHSCDILLLWIPGGGFRLDFGPLYTSTFVDWISSLEASKNLRCAIFVADYKKSPEAQYPGAVHDIIAVHEFIMDTTRIPANKIVWGADDAGAAIALDALHSMHTDKHSANLPSGLILASPYIGMEAGGESWRKNLSRDYLTAGAVEHMETAYLPPEKYDYDEDIFVPSAGEQPFRYLSGIHKPDTKEWGEFLPRRMLVVTGKHEVLLDDARNTAVRARHNGVQVDVLEQPGQVHLWSMLGTSFTQDQAAWQASVDHWVDFMARSAS